MRVVVTFEAESVMEVLKQLSSLDVNVLKAGEEEPKPVQGPSYRGDRGDVASTVSSAVRSAVVNDGN